MSASTASRHPSIHQHLCAIKKLLQDVTDTKAATTRDKVEVDLLEEETFEILRLIRSWRNNLAPINRIPPEVLALLPDSWDVGHKQQGVIRLTHVCRAWREIFISRPSLWADFDCKDVHKTRLYLNRSKSSPIDVSLIRYGDLLPRDPFLYIIPRSIGRLKSLFIGAVPENLQDIVVHLSRPAPLLEYLFIAGRFGIASLHNPVLAPTLFNGDLSSLRELRLQSVRTELPWRNMVNLISFTLACTSPDEISVGHLLDFFESAPLLREVQLHDATPTSGAQNGRLVSLACLEKMDIRGVGPTSLLLDHLLIPVGAKLATQINSLGSPLTEGHLPRSLDNLRNLPGFTEINLDARGHVPCIRFGGPNGEVTMVSITPRPIITRLVLESLALFDTSRAELLKIERGYYSSRDLPYQTLLPMKCLRTLTLSRCGGLNIFIDALHPKTSSEVVVCPKLEELVLVLRVEKLDIKDVMGMAAARASRGAKLKSLRIITRDKVTRTDVPEPTKHVLDLEWGPDVGESSSDSDGDSDSSD